MSKQSVVSEMTINDQTLEIFKNLLNYYNGSNEIKCTIEENKIQERIRRFYNVVKNDSKLNGYLLKRNKLLFYKNKDTEILPKINLYAYLKSEERETVVEKIWDNLTLIYLSIEESLETKDKEVFENLTKTLEAGSLGKLMDNMGDEIKNMDVNGLFEKLKSTSTPETKKQASNLISDMLSKLTDNMGDISKSQNPSEALLANLQNLAQDYSKMFESGKLDFGSFLSAVPDILNNPEELTKNIDMSKLEGLDLPDLNGMLNSSNINMDKAGLGDLMKGLNGMDKEGLSGLMSSMGGMSGQDGESTGVNDLMSGGLGGLMSGKLGESLNKMMGGKLDDMVATLIEKQGVTMLDSMVKAEEDKKNQKPLTDKQIDELEEFLKNQKLDMD
jgi:hypothetical protein